MPVFNTITSKDNERLKFARRVRDGMEDNTIFVEGVRLVEEVLASDIQIIEAFASDIFFVSGNGPRITSELERRGGPVSLLSESLFRTTADTKHPQGIIVIAKRPDNAGEAALFANESKSAGWPPLIVFLQAVNNPSNLGAIVRTAEAAGARGVIVSNNSADPFSPKSLRASMGSAFRTPISTDADLQTTVQTARENGYQIIAADTGGGMNYAEVDWSTPSLLVFGSEADGLADDDLKLLDRTIYIPMAESVESLNLAVSCGVILFEAKRQVEINRISE